MRRKDRIGLRASRGTGNFVRITEPRDTADRLGNEIVPRAALTLKLGTYLFFTV